jgi:hypothetical protein
MMDFSNSRLICVMVIAFGVNTFSGSACAHANDTSVLRALLRKANGGVAQLEQEKTYEIDQKLQLNTLCPDGVVIEGNDATIRALVGFKHNAMLVATTLLRDDPYEAGVVIRNLTLDGNMQVGRPLFGFWKNAIVESLTVSGGTIYQVNALWHDSSLSDIRVIGNPDQTNNGFDCNLRNSTIRDVEVNMHGNMKESAFWLNGCDHARVIRPVLTDGRTAFGLENCKNVNVIGMKIRGEYSFRVVNILPADASEAIHLYDLDLDVRHVGEDPSAGVHFNATKGGLVARGKIRSTGPGVMLSNGASDIDVIGVILPTQPIHPVSEWIKLKNRRGWASRLRETRGRMVNRAPVVDAGADQSSGILKEITLEATVADEFDRKKLKLMWTKAAGPGKVQFQPSTSAATKVRVSRPGRYTLRLTVSDGKSEVFDEVTITAGAKDGDQRG